MQNLQDVLNLAGLAAIMVAVLSVFFTMGEKKVLAGASGWYWVKLRCLLFLWYILRIILGFTVALCLIGLAAVLKDSQNAWVPLLGLLMLALGLYTRRRLKPLVYV